MKANKKLTLNTNTEPRSTAPNPRGTVANRSTVPYLRSTIPNPRSMFLNVCTTKAGKICDQICEKGSSICIQFSKLRRP